jgi:hypothetical protein
MKLDEELSPFAAWIVPKNGGPPYYVDFSEFYFGRHRSELSRKAQRFWKSDIVGMPNLARDFQTVILSERPAENVYLTQASAWRNMYRFIQDCPDLPHAMSISDIGEIHGLRLKQWLFNNGMTAHTYKQIKWAIDRFSQIHRGTPSEMPPRDALPEPDPIEPDFVALQRLSLVLRKHARSIFSMWKDGAALAAQGSDPRMEFGGTIGDWGKRENHAHLIYRLTETCVPSYNEVVAQGWRSLVKTTSSARPAQNIKGANCPIPGITPAATHGYPSKLRWRFPSEVDMAVFIWIVLIYTGFNLSTILAIDIGEPSKWYVPALQDPDHVLLFSDKDRANKKVYAPSKVKAQFHAFNLIKTLIEITEPLRETLRMKVKLLRNSNEKIYSHETQREIQKLERSIRSPWLYISLTTREDTCPVRSVQLNDSSYLNSIVRLIAEDANLTEDHPYLKTLTTSQARDSMINFTFRNSRRISVARLVAQQSDYRSLRYYLARRKIKRANFQTVNQVLTHTFGQIRHRDVFDETRIKIAMKTGEITPEQERRLRDVRLRTRVGLGCKNPTNPPSEIDPHHPEGQICRVQRCTGCFHGVVFPESVRPLAYTLADLRYQQRKIGLATWKGSTFEEEEISILETLKQFDQHVVKKHFQERANALMRGEEISFDVYPQY